MFTSDAKIDHIAQRLKLPEVAPSGVSGVPSMLVINFQIPTYQAPNPVWGKTKEDGEGLQLVFCLRLSDEGRAAFRNGAASAQLFQDFADPNADETTRNRLKMVARILNANDVAMGRLAKSLVTTYNAKPMLTRPQHSFYEGPGYFEMDLDAHSYCYSVRKGLNTTWHLLDKFVIEIGFTVEGTTNEQLPEQLLCGITLNMPDIGQARHIS
jgi:hypothetical protein